MGREGRPFDPFGGSPGRNPARPRRVSGGVKARSRRGEFARTWWGRRWIEALEGSGWAERLARGRNYARAGQVVGLRVGPGNVEASVQGSRPKPYRVRVAVRPLSAVNWSKLFAQLRSRADVGAALLSGEMPESIEAAFAAAGIALLPTPNQDLAADCSCPDWANPCKHIAAVHYLLAESMDRDPFILLALRGRSRSEVVSALRPRRVGRPRTRPRTPGVARTPVAIPGASPEPFWGDGPRLRSLPALPIVPSEVPDAVLRRLGEPAFLRGTSELVDHLRAAYDRLGERARVEIVARAKRPEDVGGGSADATRTPGPLGAPAYERPRSRS